MPSHQATPMPTQTTPSTYQGTCPPTNNKRILTTRRRWRDCQRIATWRIFWLTTTRYLERGIRGLRSRLTFRLAVFWIRGIRLLGRSIVIILLDGGGGLRDGMSGRVRSMGRSNDISICVLAGMKRISTFCHYSGASVHCFLSCGASELRPAGLKS